MLKSKNSIVKYVKKNWIGILAIIFLMLAIFIVYNGWFNTDIIARGDWKARSSAWIKDWLNIPYAWDNAEYGGISNIFGGRLIRYPLYFAQALMNHFWGLSYAITERVIWFYSFLIISSLSIYFLTKEIFKSKIAGYAAIFIFLFNNFTIFRANGAQMVLLMGQALTPLVILFYIRAIKYKRFYLNTMLAAVFLALLSYNDVRLAILCIGLIFLYAAYMIISKLSSKENYPEISIKQIIAGFLVVSGICVLLNSYWFIPTGFSRGQQELVEENFSSIDQVKSLSRVSFMNTLSLSMGNDAQFGRYVYSQDQILAYLAWILPFLLLIPLFLKKRKREILFWFFVYIVFAFFAKGMMPPASSINQFFYDHVPLSSMYRLPDKFLYIMATPFAMIYGLSLAEILKLINKDHVYKRLIIILIYILLPIIIIFPAIFGKYSLKNAEGGSSFKSEIPEEYLTIENWLNKEPVDYKTLWVLGTPRYDIFSNSHSNFLPLDTVQKNSIYNKDYVEFLKYSQDMNKYLSLMNIKYFMLTPANDPDWTWHSENRQLKNYLDSINENFNFNLKRVPLGNSIYVYESSDPLEKINAAQSAMLISGSKKAYDYIFQNNLIDIHDWNFYVNENDKEVFDKTKDTIDTILFYNSSIDDLLLTNIYKDYDQIASYNYNNYNETLKKFEETSFGTNFQNIKTDKMINEIDFNFNARNNANYQLWTRVAFSDFEDPSMEIYIDGKYVNVIHPDSKYFKQYQWIKIDNIYLTSGDHDVKIKTKSGDISIDKFIFIPDEEYIAKKNSVENWLKNKNILDVNCYNGSCLEKDIDKKIFSEKNNIEVAGWKEINPTEYLIRARVNKAGYINLVENFDPNWSAYYENTESKSIINNTISNSFYIDPQGEGEEIDITVRYNPQGILETGYKIYICVIFVLCLGLIYALIKKK